MTQIYIYIYIYIYYNYESYKLIIKIYVYKYVSVFLAERCFSWLAQKDLFLIFIIIIKIHTISLSFYKINVFLLFKIVLEQC